MKLAKRLPIFVSAGLLTFALGVWMTPVEQQSLLVLRQDPWQMLLTFENQDLQALDEQSLRKVKAAVEAITGKRDDNFLGQFQPALFRLLSNTKGEKRYVLVEEAPLVLIPGNATLRVHVFDTTGRLRNAQEFSAGHRMSITSMRIREVPVVEHQLLIVDTEYCLGGHPSSQYYVSPVTAWRWYILNRTDASTKLPIHQGA